MNKFFGIDSPFFRVMTKVADFILLNFLVLIFSIPIITIGPALTAMYYVALKEVRGDEGYLFKSFLKGFKDNFKRGVLYELLIILAGTILYVNIVTCYRWSYEGSTFGQILMFLNIGLGLIVVASVIYLFPLQAQFSNTFKGTLFNSLLMAMKHLPQTIVLLISTAIIVYAIISYPLFIFFFIGILAYVQCYILVRVFKPYMPEEEFVSDEYNVPEDVDDIWEELAKTNEENAENADK